MNSTIFQFHSVYGIQNLYNMFSKIYFRGPRNSTDPPTTSLSPNATTEGPIQETATGTTTSTTIDTTTEELPTECTFTGGPNDGYNWKTQGYSETGFGKKSFCLVEGRVSTYTGFIVLFAPQLFIVRRQTDLRS